MTLHCYLAREGHPKLWGIRKNMTLHGFYTCVYKILHTAGTPVFQLVQVMTVFFLIQVSKHLNYLFAMRFITIQFYYPFFL